MGRKIPETLTEKEMFEVMKQTKKKTHQLAFMLGFYQAMRISEVVKLTKENIDMNRNLIMIKEAKGQKDRNIPIAPEVRKFLKHLPVGVGVRALQTSIKNKCRDILNKDIHFHSLRHSGATMYLNDRGWNIRVVQNFLGHSDVSTTMIYTHIRPEDMMKAMYGVEQ